MEEINFIRPQEVFNRNTGESKVRYTSYDGSNKFIPVVDGENGVPRTLVVTTHAELKAMRDAGKLTPGSLYRITDYQCTTTQENTRSAGHQFDIVLLALSENKLAEEGWAMMHENDTYFANSNLSAWKVWYSLDNDKSRFAWADDSVDEGTEASMTAYKPASQYTGPEERYICFRDVEYDKIINNENYYAWLSYGSNDTISRGRYTKSLIPSNGDTIYGVGGNEVYDIGQTVESYTPAQESTGLENGRGVIYRLIDEFNNDIKYDFKNIQFKRKLTDGSYDANGTETWCYTLNVWYNDMCQDASIVGNTLPNSWNYISGVYDNVFGYATAMDLFIEGANTFAFVLGNNVVLSFLQFSHYSGIYSNTIGNGFCNNTIGDNFNSNIIGNYFINNTIGNGFVANIIRNGFRNNTIGNDFYGNTIGNDFLNKNISTRLTYANYGNDGVELATKS